VRGYGVRESVSDDCAILALRIQGNLQMAVAPAKEVANKIGGDGVEPGRELQPRVETGAIVVNADERFLRNVGGVGFIL
jgi:hypothetical protein